jgi:hypothetical protein
MLNTIEKNIMDSLDLQEIQIALEDLGILLQSPENNKELIWQCYQDIAKYFDIDCGKFLQSNRQPKQTSFDYFGYSLDMLKTYVREHYD